MNSKDGKHAESLGSSTRQPGYNPAYPPPNPTHTLPPPEYPGVGSVQSGTSSSGKHNHEQSNVDAASNRHNQESYSEPQQYPPHVRPVPYPSVPGAHQHTQLRSQQQMPQRSQSEPQQAQQEQQPPPPPQQQQQPKVSAQAENTTSNVNQTHSAPAINGAYPTYINQQPHIQDISVTYVKESVGYSPQALFCPKCGKAVASKVKMENGCCTYACAFALCFVCCCCLAFCFPWTKDAYHKCPYCKSRLGSKARVL